MIRYLNFLGKVSLVSLLSTILYLASINPTYAGNLSTITATVSISICGNGVVEGGEVCDISNINNFSCNDFGYEYGELKCSISCDEYDVTNCSHSKEEISSQEVDILEQKIVEEVNLEEEKESNIVDRKVYQVAESLIKEKKDSMLLNSNDILDSDLTSEDSINDQIEFFEYEEIDISQNFIGRAPP